MQRESTWAKLICVLAVTAALVAICPGADARAKRKENAAGDAGEISRQEELERARQEVLTILRSQNGCSAWFREADPDVAKTFQSLRFEIVSEQNTFIQQTGDGHGGFLFKDPWAARTRELAGRDAVVEFNSHGSVFLASLPVVEIPSAHSAGRYRGFRQLTVGSFRGRSLAAQMTALLHELAHVIGRIPADDDSWDGRSKQNTQEVLHSCKTDIRAAVRAAEHAEN